MGAGVPSKLLAVSSLHSNARGVGAAVSPFGVHPKCRQQQNSFTKANLQTLVLRQDWQKVLIRLHLYPSECQQVWNIDVYGIPEPRHTLTPSSIHSLVCALDPPAAVVQQCLKCFPDAATLSIRVVPTISRRWGLGRSWKAWRARRRGAFPVFEDEDESLCASIEQRQLLLPYVEDDDDDDAWSANSRSSSSSSSSKSSLSTNHSHGGSKHTQKSVILQLSPSGGLAPLPVNTSNETDSTSDSSKSSVYRVKWDLKPLWKQVADRGMLMPLHIACLFQASPETLEVLVETYPLAALADILGMLPIHWVAAGWSLPPLEPPPVQCVPRDAKPGPMPALHVLRKALPECIHIRSGNHGMLAANYIQECMEDSQYKRLCLRVLSDGIDYMMEYGEASVDHTLVFCDTDETSDYPSMRLFAGLSGLILDEDWSKAIAVVEGDSLTAQRWYYGVDTETVGATVWKRLPIHLACANGAPLGLIDVLLKAFPESAVLEDPHDGALPLHIACRAGAPLPVVRRLVEECPEVVLAVDGGGRVPLHVAVLSQGPYVVIEYLLLQDMESVVALDRHGRTPMDYAIQLHSSNGPIVELLTMMLSRLDRPSYT
eukprot:scaffold42088_cov191-Amphora_coffeaeformis.AAC.2